MEVVAVLVAEVVVVMGAFMTPEAVAEQVAVDTPLLRLMLHLDLPSTIVLRAVAAEAVMAAISMMVITETGAEIPQ